MSKEQTALATRETAVAIGFGNKEGFELMQRAATLLSKSTLVPKEYQNNVANCTIALNMSNRMQADPLMVMQNLHIVHGRPSWSSQFLISACNTSKKFSPLRYEWFGEPHTDQWGCRAWAYELATGDRLEGSVVNIKMAKDEGWYTRNGSKWQTMPQQMLMYRAAAFFVRVYAPEIAMGLHTRDEIEDMGDVIDAVPMDDAQYEAYVSEQANAETIGAEEDNIFGSPGEDWDERDGEPDTIDAEPVEPESTDKPSKREPAF